MVVHCLTVRIRVIYIVSINRNGDKRSGALCAQTKKARATDGEQTRTRYASRTNVRELRATVEFTDRGLNSDIASEACHASEQEQLCANTLSRIELVC